MYVFQTFTFYNDVNMIPWSVLGPLIVFLAILESWKFSDVEENLFEFEQWITKNDKLFHYNLNLV